MTTIGLSANDQLLAVTLNPKLASGQQNTVDIRVEFSDDWDGFAKSAVFFTSNDTNTVYEKVLTNGECVIPAEVMSKDGVLYIGVRGVNSQNNEVKTTSLVKYKISEGSPSGAGTEVEPTPNVYQQLLSAYGKTDNSINKEISDRKSAIATEKAERQIEIAVERARITNLATLSEGSTTGDAELIDARVGFDGKVYRSVGNAIRSQALYIDPPRMRLSSDDLWITGLKVGTTFVGNKYYVLTEVGQLPHEVTTTNGSGMITFPCVSGEKYSIHYSNYPPEYGIIEVRHSIVPLKEDGTCAVNMSEIANYVREYDPENNIYLLTIPENATNIYIAADGTIGTDKLIEIKQVYGRYNIDWLELNENNFPDNCVPLSALQKQEEGRLIYQTTLTEDVRQISISKDSNGQEFLLNNIAVIVCIPASPTLNSFSFLSLKINDFIPYNNQTIITKGEEGKKHVVMFRCDRDNGLWSRMAGTGLNQIYTDFYMSSLKGVEFWDYYVNKFEAARNITLSPTGADSVIPKGTKIEVYGR